ncbi:MAG TPA: hypothetical protein VN649_20435 [Ramlibacter sp.]|nr:hypothetical protein [Ramlibacter sp.]
MRRKWAPPRRLETVPGLAQVLEQAQVPAQVPELVQAPGLGLGQVLEQAQVPVQALEPELAQGPGPELARVLELGW